jgi:hypothetical protein
LGTVEILDRVRRTEPYGTYTNKLSVFVEDKSNFPIILPHVLIQSTKLAACLECERKAYLQDVTASGGSNLIALVGVIIHNLIQSLMLGLSPEELPDTVTNWINRESYSIFLAGEKIETVEKKIAEYVPIRAMSEASRGPVLPGPQPFDSSHTVSLPIETLPPYGLTVVNKEENYALLNGD